MCGYAISFLVVRFVLAVHLSPALVVFVISNFVCARVHLINFFGYAFLFIGGFLAGILSVALVFAFISNAFAWVGPQGKFCSYAFSFLVFGFVLAVLSSPAF